jgi:hypothetical protein
VNYYSPFQNILNFYSGVHPTLSCEASDGIAILEKPISIHFESQYFFIHTHTLTLHVLHIPTSTHSYILMLNPTGNQPTTSNKSSVIIFDWDDTILPSTFVDDARINSFHDLPIHWQNIMNEVARVATKCLAAAAKYGQVLIITNSDEGWVKFSAERYMPSIVPILDKYKIVSARTGYEEFYPGRPLCWKAAAFAHEVNETYLEMEEAMAGLTSTDVSSDGSDLGMYSDTFYTNKRKYSRGRNKIETFGAREVISFGDSMEERTAVKIVSSQLNAMPKSVMFIASPSPEQLIGQLAMMTTHMRYICEHRDPLDLEISAEQAERYAVGILQKRKILSYTNNKNGVDSCAVAASQGHAIIPQLRTLN